ncbi:hypothetical protein OG871_33625 [Kitasatospora sp. NBC_00374]|uniref:hypothetical protein n=1 Tax=Kitasatospora sp. NBC_00374 TaxID=2975964 RepID=UPI0030E5C74A
MHSIAGPEQHARAEIEDTMGKRRGGPTDRAGTAPKRFALGREVLVAYAAPALSAGAGGLITGQTGLAIAAGTSIAGGSALAAALTGGWLQRGRTRRRWPARAPKALLAGGAALAAAAVAALAAHLTTTGLDGRTGVHLTPVLDRLPMDLPVSAALAAAIVSWRWRVLHREPDGGPHSAS